MVPLNVRLLFLSTFIYSVNSWNCEQPVETIALSATPYFIPGNSTVPQEYDKNINCTWQFTIPKGRYALITINSNFSQGDTFIIENSKGYSHHYVNIGDIPKQSQGSYYFPADPETTISLESESGGYLTLSIVLKNLSNWEPQFAAVRPSYPVIIPLKKAQSTTLVFTGDSKFMINLAVVEADNIFDSCFLYQGDNPSTGEFLSGLKSLSLGIITSANSGSSISLVCLDNGPYPEAYIFATTVSFGFDTQSLWLMRTGENIFETLYTGSPDAIVRPAYLTSFCPKGCVEYLQYVLPYYDNPNSTLTLSAGMPGGLQTLTSFNVSDAASNLPQELRGTMRTYSIDSEQLILKIDRNSTGFAIARAGRKGFFMTQNYPFLSTAQDAATRINATDALNFSFEIETMSLGGGNFSAEINYKEMKEYSVILSTDISDGDPIPAQMGYSMAFEMYQGPNASTGGLVRFEITSSGNNMIAVISLLLAAMTICL